MTPLNQLLSNCLSPARAEGSLSPTGPFILALDVPIPVVIVKITEIVGSG